MHPSDPPPAFWRHIQADLPVLKIRAPENKGGRSVLNVLIFREGRRLGAVEQVAGGTEGYNLYHSFLGLLRKGGTRRVGQTEPESVTRPNKHDFAVSLKDSAREGWDNVGWDRDKISNVGWDKETMRLFDLSPPVPVPPLVHFGVSWKVLIFLWFFMVFDGFLVDLDEKKESKFACF